MADQSYLDRLYNEIGQYGDRIRATFGGSGGFRQIADNWGTTYQPSYSDSVAEQNRLRLQQAKEEYDLQANAGRLSAEEAFQKQAALERIGQSIQQLERRTGMPTASPAEIMQRQTAAQPPVAVDPYAQYLQENAAALQGPYLPQDQYAAPTREEYQRYWQQGEAPQKAVLAQQPVASVAPASLPQVSQQDALGEIGATDAARKQAAPALRPVTIKEQIEALPFPADRQDAMHNLLKSAKIKKINEAYSSINNTLGLNTTEGERTLNAVLNQIKENWDVPKPFNESEEAKTIKQNWEKLQPRSQKIEKAKSSLELGQKLLSQGDRQGALALFKQTLMKDINSLSSDDAVGNAELLIKFPELVDASEINMLRNIPIWKSASPYIDKMLRKDVSFEQKKQAFIDAMGTVPQSDRVSFLNGFFEKQLNKANADPYRFYDTAVNTINSASNAFNDTLKAQVINPSSPKFASNIGANLIGTIKGLEELTQGQVPSQSMAPVIRRPQSQYTPDQIRAELARRKAAQ